MTVTSSPFVCFIYPSHLVINLDCELSEAGIVILLFIFCSAYHSRAISLDSAMPRVVIIMKNHLDTK